MKVRVRFRLFGGIEGLRTIDWRLLRFVNGVHAPIKLFWSGFVVWIGFRDLGLLRELH